jgi:hypothetical protein
METQTVPVELHGRIYGDAVSPREKFFQPADVLHQQLVGVFEAQSALLQLSVDSEFDKDPVYAAYEQDLGLLTGAQADFELCMKQALASSFRDKMAADAVKIQTNKMWEQLQQKLPALGKAPILELSHIRAAKPAEVLLAELQDEFHLGAARLAQRFCFWLHLLVESEVIGLIEWAADDVCRYYYFRHELSEVVKTENKLTVDFDPTQEFGQRYTDTTVNRRQIQKSLFQERHIHTVVKAGRHTLEAYTSQIPVRIADFLETIPKWLRPLVRIVNGQIVMEEVVRLKVGEEITEEEVVSVYKYSPGLQLADYNLIGWSGDDNQNEKTRFANMQEVFLEQERQAAATKTAAKAKAERSQEFSTMAWVFVWLVMLLGAGFAAKSWWTDRSHREAEANKQYAKYLVANQGGTVNELTNTYDHDKNILMVLGKSLASLTGVDVSGRQVVLAAPAIDGKPGEQRFTVRIPAVNWDDKGYGDVDLYPQFGVKAVMHILSAGTEDGTNQPKLKYTLTPY